jgi:hypothetical protein
MTVMKSQQVHDRYRFYGWGGKRGVPCRRPDGWGTAHVGSGVL